MAQQHTLGRTATTVAVRDGWTVITYHDTEVVRFNTEMVELNTGGWSTQTTRTRMNQASSQFDLGFRVYQKKWQWHVVTPRGDVMPFSRSVQFPR